VGSSIIHISSHAFTGRDSLDAPHIEFFDEPFYLFELQGLNMHPALVVLSACRTGDGRYISGEGVQCLARGFSAGGASAVVAGWWNVNDAAAGRLMADFYAQLDVQYGGSGRINAANALRAVKLVWLNDGSHLPLLQLPYYWAALNYQGNPMPFVNGSLGALAPPSVWYRVGQWFSGGGVMPGRIIMALVLLFAAGLLLFLGRRLN
jgi:CHAT domain-containing protein